MMNEYRIADLTILDWDAFLEAGIDQLELCYQLVEGHGVRFQALPGRGLGRLVDLVQWQPGFHVEHIDGPTLGADQLMHLGMHLALEHLIDVDNGDELLWAECVASSLDLFCLGRFLTTQVNSPFSDDLLESLHYHYETYCDDSDHLESLITACLEDPVAVAGNSSEFLHRSGHDLGQPTHDPQRWELMVGHHLYPLIHHFNLTNWILMGRLRTAKPVQSTRIEELSRRVFDHQNPIDDVLERAIRSLNRNSEL